jgi:hypothetical protein
MPITSRYGIRFSWCWQAFEAENAFVVAVLRHGAG